MSTTSKQLTGDTTLVKPELSGMVLVARRVVLHQDADNAGIWSVECPSFVGCISQGHTMEEALSGIKEAIELWLETALGFGDFIPAVEGH